MGNHVFICYAREDREFVVKFATHLKERSVPVWLDLWDIQPSQDWDKTIDDAIYECAKFLIVLSPTAVASQEVRGELRTALDEGKPITPVIYQVCRVPRQLRTVQYVDFTARGAEDTVALDQVVRVLSGAQASLPPEPRVPDTPLPLPRQRKRGWSLGVALGLIAVLLVVAYLFPRQGTRDLPSTLPPKVEEQQSIRETTTSVPEAQLPETEVKQSDRKDMIAIPAGEFWMGCNEKADTQCEDDEKPGREVYLDTYSIDKYEVTMANYQRCVEAGTCTDKGLTQYDACNWDEKDKNNYPINCVDWDQAQTYCRWAGKRLPTEAEWEKAARGEKDRRIYPWGESWEAKNANAGSSGTVAVGSYTAGVSPYGVHDMAGNVWEWVQDWYAADYYRSGSERNPEGPGRGDFASVGKRFPTQRQ